MKQRSKKIPVGMFYLFWVYGVLFATTWRSDDFFGDWMQWQHCYNSQSFVSMRDHLNDMYLRGFESKFLKHKDEMMDLMPFLIQYCPGLINSDGQLDAEPNLNECRDKLAQVYEWLSDDPGKLLSYLKNDPLFNNDGINKSEQDADINVVINKYKSLAKLLFACPDSRLRGEFLFAMAGQLFKWCFSPEHWYEFKSYLDDTKSYPVARFTCSIIWNYLVGRGWKDWNCKAIEDLKQQSDAGAKVVYIAGGTDVLQLLKNEIYNIHIIDPFLPSQGRYYSDPSWKRWISGSSKNWGSGDKVIFDFEGKKIELIRNNFKKTGEFEAQLSTGEVAKLEKSITDWKVVGPNRKVLGHVVFDRRFATQKDFTPGKKKVVLMSFNEMYYAFQPVSSGGWGMDLSQVSNDFNIYVKQLTFPINKGYLNSINESERVKLDFIKLGSCAT